MTTQNGGSSDADMGQAYLDIAAAEQQATLLENQLRALESKIGEFLDEHDADVDVDAPDPNAGTADMQACAAREHAPAGSSNNSSNTDDASKKQTNGA